VNIRVADRDDIPRLLPLVRQYWEYESIPGFEPVRIGALLEQLLTHPHLGMVWVAQSGERLAGYLAAVFLLSLEHQGLIAEIDELFVLAEDRATGVGSRLLAAAEGSLAATGCVRIQLQLGDANGRAHAFYCGRGYTQPAARSLLEKALSAGA
jgi:GNAT superfamily N-acetyltransferase